MKTHFRLAHAAWLAALLSVLSSACEASASDNEPRAAESCSTRLSVSDAVKLQTRWFDTLSRLDRKMYEQLTSPDAVIHERGEALSRTKFFELMQQTHQKGMRITWSVQNPYVTADCNLMAIRYTNVGTFKTGAGPVKPISWIEIAVYVRNNAGWQVIEESSERTNDGDVESRAVATKILNDVVHRP